MIPQEKINEIEALVLRIAKQYKKYEQLSEEIEALILPYIHQARDTKNLKLISKLLRHTAAFDKRGQPLCGEFLGRFYLFGEMNLIDKAIKEGKTVKEIEEERNANMRTINANTVATDDAQRDTSNTQTNN